MPGDGGFLKFRNLVIAHSLEVVVCFVVFPDMLQAKAEILSIPPSPLGGKMLSLFRTIPPLAFRVFCFSPAVFIGLYADGIEIFRVQIHDVSV